MRIVSFYHRETGAIRDLHLTTTDDALVDLNTPPDHIAIDGHHDFRTRRVDPSTGEVVDRAPDDPPPETAATVRRAKLLRILELEASQPTLLRKHALGDPEATTQLRSIDAEIEALRGDIATLSQGQFAGRIAP